MATIVCDIAVIGASLGGLRAAISAAKCGKKVVLTEECDWVGGQMTSQGVPPDEHKYIEVQGSTASYAAYRRKVREHYSSLPNFSPALKALYNSFDALSPAIKQEKWLDMGASWVSRVAHDPAVGHQIFMDELRPFIESGLVILMLFTVAKAAETDGDYVKRVVVKNTKSGEETTLVADYFLDGTDCGDLLPLTETEFRTGSDAKHVTGEPSAPEVPVENDVQPITWVFALELVDKLQESDRIAKPKNYDFYKKLKAHYDDNNVLSWYCIGFNGKKRILRMFSNEVNEGSKGLWEYRRIVGQENYTTKVNEVSLINWPQQDYIFGSIYGNPDTQMHKEEAKNFSLCLAYWIQNDAPRIDGGFGYPVRLSGKPLGTEDGFAKMPYVRESRRIVAKHTILEQDVSRDYTVSMKRYPDSVGVGLYKLDFHETLVTHFSTSQPTNPFEIPLGALIPVRVKNLLPACKNIGVTHITSVCYRLHPIEWNIGESSGYLAAFCHDNRVTPAEVYCSSELTGKLQELLVKNGIQLHWELTDDQLS